jgi:hypothetical protein
MRSPVSSARRAGELERRSEKECVFGCVCVWPVACDRGQGSASKDAANTHIHTGLIAHNARARLQGRLIAFA